MYAIRSYYDPLSGRAYVYQAMRVTGAADPTVPVEDTMKGKLSQKKLVRGAASGYSVITSYSIHYTKLYETF